MSRFIGLFERIRNVELEGQLVVEGLHSGVITKEQLVAMKDLSLKAHEVVIGGFAALGTGALVGVGSYGGAMMFAAASTGTAISTLSGVAATNATLAWFGEAPWQPVVLAWLAEWQFLGGLVAGPVLAVGGLVLAAKARENLATSRTNLAEAGRAAGEMKNATSILNGIYSVATAFGTIIHQVHTRMVRVLDDLEDVILKSGTDYSRSSLSERKRVHVAVEFAQVMKLLIETPLLTKQGGVDPDHAKALTVGRKLLESASQ